VSLLKTNFKLQIANENENENENENQNENENENENQNLKKLVIPRRSSLLRNKSPKKSQKMHTLHSVFAC